MPLSSSLLQNNARLQAVAAGGPSVKERPAEYADPEAVKCIQEALKKLGFAGRDGKPLVIDGKYGDNTYFAVKSFQTVAFRGDPREIDGRVGFKTIAKLDAALGKGGAPDPPVPPPPPAPVKVAADVVVRFIGGSGNGRLAPRTVLPDPGNHATKKDRTLFRIGSETNSIGVASAVLLQTLVREIQEAFRQNSPGKVFIYGSSSGGRNALDLCAALALVSIPVEFVATIDAAWFPGEATNRFSLLLSVGNPLAKFASPGILNARQKFDYFQRRGNHAKAGLANLGPPRFTSSMLNEEIHGLVEGSTPKDLTDRLAAKEDSQAHNEVTQIATPLVQAQIKALLEAL